MRRRVAAITVAAVAVGLIGTGAADASWAAVASGPPMIRATTVRPTPTFTVTCAGGGLKLTWSLSPDTFVTAYHVTRTTTPGGAVQSGDLASPTTTYTDPVAAVAGTTYSYTISAKVANWLSTTLSGSRSYTLSGTKTVCG